MAIQVPHTTPKSYELHNSIYEKPIVCPLQITTTPSNQLLFAYQQREKSLFVIDFQSSQKHVEQLEFEDEFFNECNDSKNRDPICRSLMKFWVETEKEGWIMCSSFHPCVINNISRNWMEIVKVEWDLEQKIMKRVSPWHKTQNIQIPPRTSYRFHIFGQQPCFILSFNDQNERLHQWHFFDMQKIDSNSSSQNVDPNSFTQNASNKQPYVLDFDANFDIDEEDVEENLDFYSACPLKTDEFVYFLHEPLYLNCRQGFTFDLFVEKNAKIGKWDLKEGKMRAIDLTNGLDFMRDLFWDRELTYVYQITGFWFDSHFTAFFEVWEKDNTSSMLRDLNLAPYRRFALLDLKKLQWIPLIFPSTPLNSGFFNFKMFNYNGNAMFLKWERNFDKEEEDDEKMCEYEMLKYSIRTPSSLTRISTLKVKELSLDKNEALKDLGNFMIDY